MNEHVSNTIANILTNISVISNFDKTESIEKSIFRLRDYLNITFVSHFKIYKPFNSISRDINKQGSCLQHMRNVAMNQHILESLTL